MQASASSLTLERAQELFRAGRLRELLEVAPGASQEDLKAACKRAYLKHHPDRGGNAEIFKLVFAASEQLRSDGRHFVFESVPPEWAAWRLRHIETIQSLLEDGEAKLRSLELKLGRAHRTRQGKDPRGNRAHSKCGSWNLCSLARLPG